jgi:hypothetical protein
MALSRLSSHGLTWMVLAQVFFAAMNVGTRMAALELPWSEIAGGMPFYALASSRIALGDAVTLGATAPIFVAALARSWASGSARTSRWQSSWASWGSWP